MRLGPLRQRDFGLLWWAGLISLTGNWVLSVALPIYVLQLTRSPAAVSLIVAAGLAGNLLFGAFAGAYVDRWDRRRILVVINGLQALLLAPLLLVSSADRVWIVVVVAFGEQALEQFSKPAENALLPRLVRGDDLAAANALNVLNNIVARLVGPALGGIAAVTVGLHGAAALDAASFALAATLCALIGGRHRASRADERHLGRELWEGLRYVGRNRYVLAVFLILAISSVGEGIMGTLFVFYVVDGLGAGGRELGWLMSAQAVGGILGSLVAARVIARFRPTSLIMTSWVFFGLVDVVIFNYPRWDTTLWPVVALFVVVGIPVGIHVSAMWTLFQLETPDRLRGRAFNVIWMGASLAGIAGTAIAGPFGERIGLLNLLTIQGAGCVVAGLLFRLVAGRGPATLVAPEPPVVASSGLRSGVASEQ
ncbi:Predicted arabinose efflux permease, MFS family [Asanoa hainanensis]|uniref:Predicted arabinose efflux permease, MFS family n=1 Tax=Asanoa hainanensis TaxID=560556 RepID=A0A239PA21_9ACTN|nr:MFS transporter [Asanoa hainanensis]SNT63920.1 Predicted arabinose efflux permease, MFS family [Asanoa hainanensis]